LDGGSPEKSQKENTMILRGLATGPIISAVEFEMHTAAEDLPDAINRSPRVQQRDRDFILPIRTGAYLPSSGPMSIVFHRICVGNVENLNNHHEIDQFRQVH
jgi:hypothetical protein